MTHKDLTVDDLAQEIRRVDGDHSLGAGALAEALMPFLRSKQAPTVAVLDEGVGVEEGSEHWRFHKEFVRDARHALELMDDVDSLVRFCSVSMPDVERYYRGSEAMWRIAHWIADLRALQTKDQSHGA